MYYFASDMHLGLEYHTPSHERERMLVRWLDEVSADAKGIFLVGDVFDFWFEYKRVVPRGFTRLLGKLSELTDRGIPIHFFHGNHDMWAYDYLHTECGVTIHPRPEVLELAGKRLFVAHGDNLYIKKPFPVKVMQGAFRSRFWRWVFGSLLHPNFTMRFGHWWSEKSRKSKHLAHRFGGENEYLVQYARQYEKCIDVDYFVFGHLHVAADYPLDDSHRVILLGEWIVKPTYAILHNNGDMELKQYS